ncbi:biotin--[acetyl-CoA-carboxylase] ligase [Euzebya sp.]|uniref:biotin--[acetyl-CoA-carboxylase] ligase n=1 Tax=Euzebya sp. TaxID=1971409 RepID=UPI0035169E56
MSETGPPEALRRSLVADVPLVAAIGWHDEIGSTNAELLSRPGAPTGTVLVADVQTAGRGRRGRTWHAPAGSSLMSSVLLRPSIPARTWPVLPLAVGTAVLEACRVVVDGMDPARLALKWPNDLLVDGVKAAGILVEASGDRVVAGMGINVDWRGVARPPEVQATSLAEAAGGDVDRWRLLEVLLVALDRHLGLAEADPGGVVGRYAPDCATVGVEVTAQGAAPIEGTAVGLTPEGHLRIRTRDGGDRVVAAGEVEHVRAAHHE